MNRRLSSTNHALFVRYIVDRGNLESDLEGLELVSLEAYGCGDVKVWKESIDMTHNAVSCLLVSIAHKPVVIRPSRQRV